ncbi:hypothetical protein MOQ_000478 [Trypanosoma cruzi marinkellei]|uniref:Starter acyltransferase (SAT) domain-containing protein n=1 Tax=Trypanosoma cruzi marinkellei TaxID=85056 RepID=K2NNC0_TRYCR|nr:hypothetical protein MOQ_000478 [Trypanosoma cruzi marinkellei]
MQASGRDSSRHHPSLSCAGVPDGCAEGNDYRVHVMHGDRSPLDVLGLLPQEPLRVDATTYSAVSLTGWRPFGLPITSSIDYDAAASRGTSHGLSVRRVSESHAALVNDLTKRNSSSLLTSSLQEFTDRGMLWSDFVVSGDDAHVEHQKHVTTANIEEKCVWTVPASARRCVLPGEGVGIAPTRPKNSTRAATLSDLQREFVSVSTTQGADNDAATVNVEDSNGGSVTCMKDVLNDAAFVMSSSSSSSSENSLLTERAAAPFPANNSERLDIARRRKRGVFGLFGTIGRGYFESFSRMFRRNQVLLEAFLERVLQSNQDLFPKEIDFIDFLRQGPRTPDEQFFMDPLISWPLHLLYEVSCFYVTAKLHGYHDTFETIRQQGGLFASGKGIFAALAVATSPTEEELVHHASRMYRATFFVGLVYSKMEKRLQMHLEKSLRRSFALLLVNISTISLQLLLDEVNKVGFGSGNCDGWCDRNKCCVIPMSKLEMTRIISTHSAIVCGHPLDLERLITILLCYAESTGVRLHMEYLLTTVPENSTFYNQRQHLEVLQMWKDNGVELEESKLQLTLYSPVDGQPWKGSSTCTLADCIASTATCSSQDLTYSLQHMRGGDVLLDFSCTTPCMSQLIAWTRRNITVLSEPADCVSISVFPSPRRSPEDGIIRETLARCARINTVLQNMKWEGKPYRACVLDLTTSFVDLGLLISSEEFLKTYSGVSYLKGSTTVRKFPGVSTTRYHQHELSADVRPNSGKDMAMNSHSDDLFCAAGGHSASAATGNIRHVIQPNEKFPFVVDIYQDSPVVRYYEMQSKGFLTRGAVEFTQRLSLCTGIAFPPHTLLMCPTVLALMELWDTYGFLRHNISDDE